MINNKFIFEKVYVRENCLLAYQLWEDHQTKAIINEYKWAAPTSIFNVTQNSAEVYYRSDVQSDFERVIIEMIKSDKMFVPRAMKRFAEVLTPLEKIWKAKRPLRSLKELVDFYFLSMQAWVGLDTAYFAPNILTVSKSDKDLALSMRQRSADFLEDTSNIFQLTLYKLFTKLGDYIKYITLDEIIKKNIPSLSELKEREKHYIFYNYIIHTNISLVDFAKKQNMLIRREEPKAVEQVKGQIAMKGLVRGKVRILTYKKEIPNLKKGEILITSMTTPDYLPAMHKAVAFVTDEGGITCHAAIVAREMGKPCVIGTKFATQVFKTGDIVEVDANSGLVKILRPKK